MHNRSKSVRDNLIRSAKSLFLTCGYNKTTLDQIAQNALITKRTLYGYFKDKDALLKAVIKDSVGEPWTFSFSSRDIMNVEDLFHILYNIASGINDTFSEPEYAQMICMCITEVSECPEINEMLDKGIMRRSLILITQIISSANEKKIVKIENPTFLANIFVGGLLVDFCSSGLMAPCKIKLHKYTQVELTSYVNTCMPMLVNKLPISTE